MRGALGPIDGVNSVDVTVGKKPFTVTYDPAKTSVDRLLAALKKAGEAAAAAN